MNDGLCGRKSPRGAEARQGEAQGPATAIPPTVLRHESMMPLMEGGRRGFAVPATTWTAASVQFQAEYTNADGTRENPKVTRYDAAQILGGLGCARVLFTRARIATVFCDGRIILKGFGFMLLAYANQVIVSTFVPSEQRTKPSELMSLAEFLSSSLIFILALYVSTAAGRWWDMRKVCLGGLWGAIDDLCLWSAAWFATGSAADLAAQRLVRRYGLLSHALLFKQARGDVDLTDLTACGLLLPAEHECLAELPSKPQVAAT